ncbi:MAG: glycosyltransferase family 4 protein [Cyclobacteriaceae bacterium]
MKILMTGFLPQGVQEANGGVVAVIQNLIEAFGKMEGLEICHLSFNKEINQQVTQQLKANVRLRFIPFKTKVDLADYFINRKALNRVIEEEQPDIIHIQEITPQLIRFLHLDLRRIVITQHGIMREELRNARTVQSTLKAFFKTLVERIIFPLFPNIIFISTYNKNIFPGIPVLSARIPNPVNRIFFDNVFHEGNPQNILFVAALSRIKNLELLLSAISILKKEGITYTLHIAGGFKNHRYEAFILKQVKELNIENHIRFHGWQSGLQILKLHHQCRLFVLSSRQETLPVAIAEAMATGRVVIASNVGAISEMIDDEINGFLFPEGYREKLIECLRYIHENPAEMKTVSLKASKKAHECYHPDHIAAATIDFYEKVIKSHPQPVST